MKEGDINYKFFHQTTLYRRRWNKIVKIRGSNGLWIVEEDEILDEIYEF